MDARTRERLPVLPVLVRAVDRWRTDTEALVAAGRDAPPGQHFSVAGQTLVRASGPMPSPATSGLRTPTTQATPLEPRRGPRLLGVGDHRGAPTHRGAGRGPDELSHHSLVQYRLPTTGTRPAPADRPVQDRHRAAPPRQPRARRRAQRHHLPGPGRTGAVPLVRARDPHEHVWLPPAPLLFQRRLGGDHHAISVGSVSSLLDEALAHTNLIDHTDGGPLRCTPHDFRRMFITDAVLNGLPPHIAQIIAGHRDLNVTMGYKAVYPEEAIQATSRSSPAGER